ncbi:UNKNOWN [Stylonychia lemnae]|uniref:Major facilitator superfamily protein n=1 Tax=Stylonychia lemnae TaxID=5949 RepID=A0A078AEW8_STYLE|nr:UNKNOWN [Stylonychia lemnae]|eukprot:CDW80057.1 UNKNOWN [Stylonychia lemnae]
MALISDGFLMVGFSPVASVIADAFNCEKIIVDAQCLTFLVMFVPCNFLVIYALNKHGLRFCVIIISVNYQLLIGAVLSIIGCWLRLLVQISGNIYLMFPGTILCSMAQVFFLNTGSRLATVWFGDKERALATAVGGLSLPIGCVLGFIVPALFFGGEGDKQKVFYKYILVQNIIVTVLSLPIIFVAKDKPSLPPSIFGATFIFFGVVGSFIFGILLDKYAKYKLVTNLISSLACLSLALAFWTLPSSNVILLTVNLAFIGFFITPIIPIGYAFAVELTFPVPESISNGMMNMVCQIYGSAMGAFSSHISSSDGKTGPIIVIGIFLITCMIGSICTFFIKEDLKRLNPEIKNQFNTYVSTDITIT